MSLLHAQNLSHGYTSGGLLTRKHRILVLHDLSLTLHEHQSLGLLGGSGSGKSTLARLLMGIEAPEQGRISFYNGAFEPASKAFLQTVQMVFQDAISAFNPQRTIGWSIAEPLRHLRGLRASEQQTRIAELLQQVQLASSDAEKLPSQLSGGQLQRAGIARALAAEPKLIILDEALSNLDRVLQVQMLGLLAELRSRLGTAFVLITHDLSLVQNFCQRVIVLAEGTVVEDRPVVPGMRFTHPAGRELQEAVLLGEPVKRSQNRASKVAL
ncbi:nickel import ATP-binding protein NikE [Pseudomonas helleri]|uniref:nickel import ATP-binding protein NikE n=1 Tax=Pseudomonas helleri TaxID=1608996 RepID=UPI003F977DAF